MKCLYVTNIENTISLFFAPHIKLLLEMGYDVTVTTSIENRTKLQEKIPNAKLHHIPFTRSIKDLTNIRVYFKLKKLLKQEKFDFIHVHTPIAAFLTRMAAPKEQAVIYTAHGFHFHENGSKISNLLFYLAEKVAAPKTSKIIVMNEEDRKKAERLFPKEKVHQIYGVGVDATFFDPSIYTKHDKKRIRESLGIKSGVKVITHIADINENKRQIDILEAAEKLKEAYQNFVILLIGDGPLLNEMKKQIVDKGLQGYVHCLGYRQDIRDILSISDVGLLVSLREGLPKSVMEMMSMEIPLVATHIRGNQDLVSDGENGFLIPTKSPEIIMESCLTLLQDDELRKRMGSKGRSKILSKFDLKIILGEMKMIYKSIIPYMNKNTFFMESGKNNSSKV